MGTKIKRRMNHYYSWLAGVFLAVSWTKQVKVVHSFGTLAAATVSFQNRLRLQPGQCKRQRLVATTKIHTRPFSSFAPISDFDSITLQALPLSSGDSEEVNIREWTSGDGPAIYIFLQQEQSLTVFDPEGSLDMDCRTETLLEESYDPDDGGCFLVVEHNGLVVGTAGLIVGTQIQYQKSGASLSSPQQVTAAIRRCCVKMSGSHTSRDILKQLLIQVEERAKQQKATELIAWAYPLGQNEQQLAKPTPALLEEIGYKALPYEQQLPGVDAIQYAKDLSMERDSAVSTTPRTERSRDDNTQNDALIASGLAAIAISIILGAWFAIAQFMGLDTTLLDDMSSSSSSYGGGAAVNVNRGLGRPLSKEDLNQLLQDEQLKRKTLDSDDSGSNAGRDWKDLTVEERREEMALLQVIQGQNIRVVK